MAAPGSTPIQLYHTTTAAAQPIAGNLLTGELAANVTDKKIYTKDGGGNVVQVASGPDATETLTNKTLTTPVLSNPSYSGTTANGGTVTTIDINGGTIDGTTIGASTRAAGNFTTLDANGNVTLGDATTDTVTVNGYMGVGGAAAGTHVKSTITGTTTGSSTQIGCYVNTTFDSGATSQASGIRSTLATVDASFIASQLAHFRAAAITKGAASTITNLHGLYIEDQTQGTNNYGITSLVSSGTNKWNIYASGTAANYFAGNVHIGVIPSDVNTLYVRGPVGYGNALAAFSAGSDSGLLAIGNANSNGAAGTQTWVGSGASYATAITFGVVNLYGRAQTRTHAAIYTDNVLAYGRADLVFATKGTSNDDDPTQKLRITNAGSLVVYNGAGTSAVFNEDGVDADFRIESDTNTHAFFLEGSSGNVGIGTSSPGQKLHVNETGVSATSTGVRIGQSGWTTQYGYAELDTSLTKFKIGTSGVSFPLTLETNGTERLRIDSSGRHIIGQSTETYTLSVKDVVGSTILGVLTSTGTGSTLGFRDLTSSSASNMPRVGCVGDAVVSYSQGTITTSVIKDKSLALQGATSQTGTGISFPATQVASSDANTLDDYREGTFTPTIVGTTTAGTGTYSIQVGRYTKIGNRVTFMAYIVWSAHTGTGNMRIGALPFTAANITNGYHAVTVRASDVALTAGNYPVAYVNINSTQIVLDQIATGGSTAASVPMDTAGSIMVSGHYEV